MIKSNSEIVLRALQLHIPVKISNYKIVMIDGLLYVRMDYKTLSQGKLIDEGINYIEYDITINHFLEECEGLSEADILNLIFKISHIKNRYEEVKSKYTEEEWKTFFFETNE